ncbi:MAG: D-glycero-alpha-D-manno-heptose-1,7-bisphosphate 7-phosphatase [Thermoplasmata archaeon]
MRPALFIDRDGTINKDCPYCNGPEQINIFEDVFEPLKELSKYFLIIIITNQSGISRGFFTEEDLKRMHEKIEREINERGGRIDAIYYCPHLPEDNCNCRKPKTGLVEKAMRDFDIDLKESFVIGNDDKDIGLAKNLGIRSIKVRDDSPSQGDYNVKDFNGVLEIISKIRLLNSSIL